VLHNLNPASGRGVIANFHIKRDTASALQAARRSDAEAFPHQQAQVEAGDVDEHSLGDM
jgi:hypothetical protein